MNSEEIKNEELKEDMDSVDATDEVETKEPENKKEKKNKHKEELDKLNKKIEELEEQLKFQKNEYLKVFAEMENTKKRLKEEAVKDRKYASQNVVGELVNPIDMLVQIVNMPATTPEVKNYQMGFQMIANQLVDILKSEGLAPIEAIGKEFDPKKMQAMETIWDSEKPEGIVLKVMQNGYLYKDRVLRPAMVVVNKKVEEPKLEEKKEEE
ncbi:MAG: nucleotide exchange factor GrpE [Acholeplasmatales bacterium]|nr:nucleotide exchange factor GrpE [Acholeplasmatales bacterium]